MKWGDETTRLTVRGWLVLVALFILAWLAVWTVANFGDDPCAGRDGQAYQNCVDLYFP